MVFKFLAASQITFGISACSRFAFSAENGILSPFYIYDPIHRSFLFIFPLELPVLLGLKLIA
jgi:hypothetical protein